MRTDHTLHPAPLAFFCFGWREAWRNIPMVIAPMVTYVLLITIFGSLFRHTPFEELGRDIGLNAETIVWYVMLTELTFFTNGINFQKVRNDVTAGLLTLFLQRPVSYLMVVLAEWCGQAIVRAILFGIVGFAVAFLMTGTVPFPLWMLLPLYFSVFLGGMIYNLLYFIVGSLEQWGPYSRPAQWVVQKFNFFFGGLILPIALYPDWLQDIAWATPFPAILTIPGSFAFAPSLEQVMQGLGLQGLWFAIILAVTVLFHHAMNVSILREGV